MKNENETIDLAKNFRKGKTVLALSLATGLSQKEIKKKLGEDPDLVPVLAQERLREARLRLFLMRCRNAGFNPQVSRDMNLIVDHVEKHCRHEKNNKSFGKDYLRSVLNGMSRGGHLLMSQLAVLSPAPAHPKENDRQGETEKAESPISGTSPIGGKEQELIRGFRKHGKTVEKLSKESGVSPGMVRTILEGDPSCSDILSEEDRKKIILEGFLERAKSAGLDPCDPGKMETLIGLVQDRVLHRNGKVFSRYHIREVLTGMLRGGDGFMNKLASLSDFSARDSASDPFSASAICSLAGGSTTLTETEKDTGEKSKEPAPVLSTSTKLEDVPDADPVIVSIRRVENLQKRRERIVTVFGPDTFERLLTEQKQSLQNVLETA